MRSCLSMKGTPVSTGGAAGASGEVLAAKFVTLRFSHSPRNPGQRSVRLGSVYAKPMVCFAL